MTNEKKFLTADGARRKLANRRGATMVFALAVFGVLAMFCAEMVIVSLNALHGSVLLRDAEKTYSSVSAAARLIQSSLRDAPEMKFTLTDAAAGSYEWESESGDEVVRELLVAALNGASSAEFVWHVECGDEAETQAFTDLRLSVAAQNADLEKFRNGYPAYMPTVVIRFSHPADGGVSPDYNMTLRVAARSVEGDGESYVVKFADGEGNLRVTSNLGAPF